MNYLLITCKDREVDFESLSFRHSVSTGEN